MEKYLVLVETKKGMVILEPSFQNSIEESKKIIKNNRRKYNFFNIVKVIESINPDTKL